MLKTNKNQNPKRYFKNISSRFYYSFSVDARYSRRFGFIFVVFGIFNFFLALHFMNIHTNFSCIHVFQHFRLLNIWLRIRFDLVRSQSFQVCCVIFLFSFFFSLICVHLRTFRYLKTKMRKGTKMKNKKK